MNCRILEIEAQRKLSYAWVVGDMDTVVTFTLTPTASGCIGFADRRTSAARYGWKMMGGKLVDLLGTSEAGFQTTVEDYVAAPTSRNTAGR